MTNRVSAGVIDLIFSLICLAMLSIMVSEIWNKVLAPRFSLGALSRGEALGLIIVASAPMIFARAMITNTKG